MKQSVLILCMAFAIFSYGWGQAGYVINGVVTGAEGQTVKLEQYLDLQPEPVEVGTTIVKNGKFSFQGHTPYPEFYMLHIGNQGFMQFFVENSDIKIFVDIKNIEQAKVTGSKENDVFVEFVNGLGQYSQQKKKLNDSYVALSKSSVIKPEAVMEVRAKIEKLNVETKDYMISFAQKHSGKITSAFIVITNNLTQSLNFSQLEQITQDFDTTMKQSQWVKPLTDYYSSLIRTAIGQPFPDITLKTPDDQPISISDYAGKGKYVLLDFWAAWCGPCRQSNPRVVELYKKYKDRGFEIIGISLDQSKDAWVKAIRDDNITWPQMSDLGYWKSAAAQLYSVNSIPHMVLLDKDGNIIAKGIYIDELTVRLAELIGN